ncbi:MAG: hypothetical protein JSR45_05125 [Proteobacteria bacterium]|nr:hypothetical protein [Pseudomonadota bacterium]
MRIRLLLALAAAALLGACNMVTTVDPMFPPSTEREKLRDGVWATTNEPCEFDAAAPVKDWPVCVGATLVKGDHITLWDPQAHNRSDVDAIWTKGPPPVAQVLMKFEPSKDPKEPDHLYVYGGFEVEKRDAQGRVVELEAWNVLCGPPRVLKPGEARTTDMTDHPFPGLTIDRNCEPKDIAALRGAAVASRPHDEHPLHMRWIRDGDS